MGTTESGDKTRERRVIGLGILGAGRGSVNHMRAASQMDDVELRGVADLDTERAEEMTGQYGGDVHRDYQDLLARDDVDAVIVALPHFLHAQAAIDSAQAGKHMLIEKPMAITLEECDGIIAACRKAGVVLQAGFTYHYHPTSAAARDLAASGELGQAVVGLEVLHGARRPDGQPAWIMSADTGGGQLWSNGVHLIDRAMNIAGRKPASVRAVIGTRMHDIDADDTETILLEFGDGLAITVMATGFYSGVSAFYGNYVFTRGMMNVSSSKLEMATGDDREYRTAPVSMEPNGFVRQLSAFARAAREGGAPEVTGEWGRDVTEVILAAFESSQSGREVPLT